MNQFTQERPGMGGVEDTDAEVYDIWTFRELATSLIPFLHSG